MILCFIDDKISRMVHHSYNHCLGRKFVFQFSRRVLKFQIWNTSYPKPHPINHNQEKHDRYEKIVAPTYRVLNANTQFGSQRRPRSEFTRAFHSVYTVCVRAAADKKKKKRFCSISLGVILRSRCNNVNKTKSLENKTLSRCAPIIVLYH